MNWRSKKDVLRLILLLFLGQVVSLIVAICSFASSLLSNHGVNTPLSQSFLTYLCLGLVYSPILIARRQKLLFPWYWYALVAFVDVAGNFLVIKAYQYTSITSVTLMDCWTIPYVLVLTWIFISTRYSLGQLAGVALCIGGLCLAVLSDAEDSSLGGKNTILGDVLVIAGTFGYAINNVTQEFCVKRRDSVEFISMVATFGLIVCFCQISIYERNNLEAVNWSSEVILLYFIFALSSSAFYSVVPFVMKMSGSALFNLSILTSDMWAVLIRLFFYKQKLNWLYFLAYGIIAVGLIIYCVTDNNPSSAPDCEGGDSDTGYQVLLDENENYSKEIGRSQRVF